MGNVNVSNSLVVLLYLQRYMKKISYTMHSLIPRNHMNQRSEISIRIFFQWGGMSQHHRCARTITFGLDWADDK